jgi:phosphoglucosamine mutase
MARLFGTDGVRGLAGRDITAEFCVSLARGAADVLGKQARSEARKPIAVIAHDPRLSSDFISSSVSAGLAASGVDVYDAGVLPTPAAAFLTADLDADFGVMISASHNPAPDNGIKIFARGGNKLPDETEDAIEKSMQGPNQEFIGVDIGRIRRFADAEDRYTVHLLGTMKNSLNGLKVVLDCAHGAASGVAPEAIRDAGAEVVVIGADPDGTNINQGFGSTHLGAIQTQVIESNADVGIAFDGDADRCLAIDEKGQIVDGDEIMTILALAAKARGELARDTLVATVMSNLGLAKAMEQANINLLRTKVGDRYVLEEMRNSGYTLGGEQSGHIIFSSHATTGDGILTGLQLMAEMAASSKKLSELTSQMTRYPQVLVNVSGVDKTKTDDPELVALIAQAEKEMGSSGRVLLRPSGTENLVRVMVEAADTGTAQGWADRLANKVSERLSL